MHYNLGVVPQWQWNIDKEKKVLSDVGKVEMLEKNVKDLQGQLQEAYIRIKDLSALK